VPEAASVDFQKYERLARDPGIIAFSFRHALKVR